MEYLSLGIIIGTFSLDGSVKVLSSTDFASERYKEGNTLYLKKDDDTITVTVKKYRRSSDCDVVSFNEITTPEEALAKKGYEVLINKDEAKLPKNYYHFYELEACEIYDQDNNHIGKVNKVLEYPAQITLKVKSNTGKEFQVPFVDAFIKNVDISNHKITINVIEGML